MNRTYRVIIPLFVALAVLTLSGFGLTIEAEAEQQAAGRLQAGIAETNDEAAAAPANTGLQAVIDSSADVKISSLGGRLPQMASSTNNSFLAIAYQQGSSIRLRSTDNDVTGWIGNPPTVGVGNAPDLAFTDGDTVQVVWLNGTVIQHAFCDLLTFAANCTSVRTLNPANINPIGPPAITYDTTSGFLYVAWIDTATDQVNTARTASSGGNWNTWDFQTIAGANLANSADSVVALAAANGVVHVAFPHNNFQFIRYLRTTAASHSWGSQRDFGKDASYTRVSHPALAAGGASGNFVYLTWDSERTTANEYALMGIGSTTGGTTWPGGGTPTSRYITTTNQIGAENSTTDPKFTRNLAGANPQEETGLRPSVAITGTGGTPDDFAVVWQEQPDNNCQPAEGGGPPDANGTSEIYLAWPAKPGETIDATWWQTGGTLANTINDYSIDPDIVIDTASQRRHIVFMAAKGITGNCQAGGGPGGYTIYYRGPYQTVQLPTTWVPLILKLVVK